MGFVQYSVFHCSDSLRENSYAESGHDRNTGTACGLAKNRYEYPYFYIFQRQADATAGIRPKQAASAAPQTAQMIP